MAGLLRDPLHLSVGCMCLFVLPLACTWLVVGWTVWLRAPVWCVFVPTVTPISHVCGLCARAATTCTHQACGGVECARQHCHTPHRHAGTRPSCVALLIFSGALAVERLTQTVYGLEGELASEKAKREAAEVCSVAHRVLVHGCRLRPSPPLVRASCCACSPPLAPRSVIAFGRGCVCAGRAACASVRLCLHGWQGAQPGASVGC